MVEAKSEDVLAMIPWQKGTHRPPGPAISSPLFPRPQTPPQPHFGGPTPPPASPLSYLAGPHHPTPSRHLSLRPKDWLIRWLQQFAQQYGIPEPPRLRIELFRAVEKRDLGYSRLLRSRILALENLKSRRQRYRTFYDVEQLAVFKHPEIRLELEMKLSTRRAIAYACQSRDSWEAREDDRKHYLVQTGPYAAYAYAYTPR